VQSREPKRRVGRKQKFFLVWLAGGEKVKRSQAVLARLRARYLCTGSSCKRSFQRAGPPTTGGTYVTRSYLVCTNAIANNGTADGWTCIAVKSIPKVRSFCAPDDSMSICAVKMQRHSRAGSCLTGLTRKPGWALSFGSVVGLQCYGHSLKRREVYGASPVA
jgi:hypothetical protein